jgi:hypothetical protein
MFIASLHGGRKRIGHAVPLKRLSLVAIVLCLFVLAANRASAQSTTFAGNAQHTSSYAPPAQNLQVIKWTTSIDLNNTGALIHYGSPLVTVANTVLVPVKTGATNGFRVDAINGASGAHKYSLGTDYLLPAHNWIPSYNPCVATGAFGTRLYYAGAGGTIWHVDNPDSNTPSAPVREVFYTSLANYNANAAAYNNTIFVNTPLTADSNGNIYFGFRVQGTAPAPLSTTQSGFARIDSNGNGKFVLAGAAANDSLVNRDSHNVAPALSNDGTTLYVVARWSTDAKYGYLIGLDSTTLATKYTVFLRDPRNNNAAEIIDEGTSSPMVAPDGDVYFGVRANPNNGARGFLLRFSGDLSVTKTPGAFGWDYTPGLVPASSVPSYSGTSAYLLFCKYNDYFTGDGSGVNRVALLDPNSTQIDPHVSAQGLVEMREVLTVIAPTPDPDVNVPAVKEWCINAPAVNPATNSVFFNSEDGHAYRWNLATNSLDQAIILNQGIGQPYVPTVIGPDGTVYTLNGGTLFALGSTSEVMVTIASSSPDLRTNIVGSTITFTATVTGPTTPTGTVTFFDVTYNGLDPESKTLAGNVPLNASGQAIVSTSSLAAGGGYLGNHFVTALYSGDANHASTFTTLMQKVHAYSTTTVLDVSPNPSGPGQQVTLTATVSGIPSGVPEVPTGMVTFFDGPIVIGQAPLDTTDVGMASITKSNFATGGHTITVTYASDTQFAASSDSKPLLVNPPIVQLSANAFGITEGTSTFFVQVNRIGDTSLASTVDYATSDTAGANNCNAISGVASSRCDYLTTIGTLHFAAGEVSRIISVPIVDDVYAEGNESFTIALSNPTGAILGSQRAAALTITDNETVNGAGNPIDMAGFFVRQHYVDFLNREPDTDGLAFWTNQITQCGSDAACIEIKRINVSAAFFLSIEFQETGYLVYRVYKSAFGNLTNPIGAPVPVRFTDFLRDTQEMGREVQVGIGNWQARLEANKQAFALAFVQRTDFLAAFPNSLTADQFVTQLDNRAGGVLSASEKASLVTVLGATPADVAKRASVLRSVAEDQDLKNAEKNQAFVLIQYFGYLRRNPNDPPESGLNFNGYNFWLGKLNQFNGNFVDADMVKAFIISTEYRQRFAP